MVANLLFGQFSKPADRLFDEIQIDLVNFDASSNRLKQSNRQLAPEMLLKLRKTFEHPPPTPIIPELERIVPKGKAEAIQYLRDTRGLLRRQKPGKRRISRVERNPDGNRLAVP